MSIIFINHDLGLIAEICDRVLVMYAGEVVESAPVKKLFANPRHPYTRLLMNAIPRLDQKRGKLTEIPGQVPSPHNFGKGCRFASRCPIAQQKCIDNSPAVFSESNDHQYRCWFADNMK